MAFDFPNSPSVGQRVTGVGGIVYVWDGVKWTNSVGGVTVQSMGDVGRNLLHNPLFAVAQRGAGPFASGSGYTLDRWVQALVGGSASYSQGGIADAQRTQIGDEAATVCLLNAFTGGAAAGNLCIVAHKMESVRRLGGKTVTVSFVAWASATLKLGMSIDQYFGSGGSPSSPVLGVGQSVTISGTVARYSMTFNVASTSGKTLGTANDDWTGLNLWYSAEATNNTRSGSVGVQSGTIAIWGVQLEVGSVATPLEKPDPQQDLAKCQRFYQVGAGQLNNTGGAWTYQFPMSFPVTMRTTPTMAANFSGQTNCSGSTFVPLNATNFVIQTTVSASTGFSCVGGYTASADL